MLVTRQIPALWNGVSQQPAAIRAPSQLEAMVNCTATVVDGVRKRNPTEHLAKLSPDRMGTAYMHTIDRDTAERYTVIVTEAGIRVFDMAGVEKTVTAPLGWDYLALPDGVDGRNGYVCMTVADFTFVLNKTKVVTMLDVGADLDPPSVDYWWLNRPMPEASPLRRTDDFDDDPVDPTPRPPQGDSGGGSGGSTPPPVVSNPSQGGYESNPTGTYKGEVQTLQDLPTSPATGDVYKIIGTDQSNFQSYYVIRMATGWYETVKPGLKNLVDATTMPHALVRQPDGTFAFGPFGWQPRHVGDENTNPHPTFVGRAIRDMFFHRNRLGFCVDENVILSRAGKFDTFYRLTVVDYLADEVIDIAASETKVTQMEFAVPMGGTMMLFSDQTQFKMTHNEVLTGTTVSLDVSTNYPMIRGVRPQPSGSDIYFASDGAGWGCVREYFVNDDGVSHDASDITAHVQRYIPAGIHTLATAPEFDSLFVLTDGAKNRVYAYRYYWQSETEKAQSAWGHWTFSDDVHVLHAKVLGGFLYLLIDRPDGTYLERIALFHGAFAGGLQWQTYLDRRCELYGSYSPATDRTTFTVPYAVSEDLRASFRCTTGDAFTKSKSASLPVSWVTSTTFTVSGDATAGAVVCGLAYTAVIRLSKQFPQNSRGEAVHTGRLQMKTLSVYFTDTAYFTAAVRPYGVGNGQSYVTEYPSRILDVSPLDALGSPVFRSGSVQIPLQANARELDIDLGSSSHLGFCFTSAEWEGFYYNRARA